MTQKTVKVNKEELEAKYESLECKIEQSLQDGGGVEEMRAELDRLAVEIWGPNEYE